MGKEEVWGGGGEGEERERGRWQGEKKESVMYVQCVSLTTILCVFSLGKACAIYSALTNHLLMSYLIEIFLLTISKLTSLCLQEQFIKLRQGP